MPRELVIVVACDICNHDLPEDSPITRLGVDRRAVELDLCEPCRGKLDKALERYLAHGHKAIENPTKPRKATAAKVNGAPAFRRSEDPQKCDRCGTWQMNGAAMAKHYTSCDGSMPPFPCEVEGCGCAYRKQNSLSGHMTAGRHIIDGQIRELAVA